MTAGTGAAMTRFVGCDASFVPLAYGSGTSKPILQASGISTFTLATLAANCSIESIRVDGASLTSSRGFSGVGTSRTWNCDGVNCKNSAFTSSTNILGYATGCATITAFINNLNYACVANANVFSGFGQGTHIGCISSGNTGSTSDGFVNLSASLTCIGCISYGNGRHGFLFTTTNGVIAQCINSYAEGQTAGSAVGFNASTAFDGVYLYNCAAYNNTTNVSGNITAGNNTGFQTLGSSGVTNAAGGNFAAAAASALIANGLPGVYPVISTTGYSDIGIQHQSTAGGGLLVHPGMTGGCNA